MAIFAASIGAVATGTAAILGYRNVTKERRKVGEAQRNAERVLHEATNTDAFLRQQLLRRYGFKMGLVRDTVKILDMD